jgi:hypothetical protein
MPPQQQAPNLPLFSPQQAGTPPAITPMPDEVWNRAYDLSTPPGKPGAMSSLWSMFGLPSGPAPDLPLYDRQKSYGG